MIPAPRFRIMARDIAGNEFECFTWTRDAASGIARAAREACEFGVVIDTIWAEEL